MGKLNTKSFAYAPSIKLQRNKFDRTKPVQTTWNFGEIVPLACIDCLPGETHSMKMGEVIQMSNPIRDLMSNVCTDIFCFFVPKRLTWKHWKEFMGENNETAGIPQTEYLEPSVNIGDGNLPDSGTLGDHLGLPVNVQGSTLNVSCLQGRAYYLIYNYFFRNQNIIAPYAVSDDDSGDILVEEGGDAASTAYSSVLLKAAKLPNYFTKALPYAIKGADVTIPLGTLAPVVTGYANTSTAQAASLNSLTRSAIANQGDYGTVYNGTDTEDNTLYADLREATAAKIEDLKFAVYQQNFLYRDAVYGTRYSELLYGHWGVMNPDSHLQQPEMIGAERIYQNIQRVIQNSGFVDGDTSSLGSVGAVSKTAGSRDLFTYTTLEHGFIFILAVSRHDLILNGNGVDRQFLKKTKWDYYWPEFAKLGAQPVYNKEIYAQGTSDDDGVFGYQEYGAEYRFLQPTISGLLNPYRQDSLSYWNMAHVFNSLPRLDQTFIEQDRSASSRVLTSGASGPDFFGDFYFIDTCVSPVSLNSYPTLGLNL